MENNTPKPLIGLIRIRNEALILQDTLDHMATFCDYIYLYDDASTDGSQNIYQRNRVIYIRNEEWNTDQMRVQGEQRKELFEYASFGHPKANFIYMDADERIDFDWDSWDRESAVVMKLFDARMTTQDQVQYQCGIGLRGFRKYFDPEFREIPFIFDNTAFYAGVACERNPHISQMQKVVHAGHVQHYGKALSKQHWQDTCAYYAKYISIYAAKWEARKKETGVVPAEGLLTWDKCLLK